MSIKHNIAGCYKKVNQIKKYFLLSSYLYFALPLVDISKVPGQNVRKYIFFIDSCKKYNKLFLPLLYT